MTRHPALLAKHVSGALEASVTANPIRSVAKAHVIARWEKAASTEPAPKATLCIAVVAKTNALRVRYVRTNKEPFVSAEVAAVARTSVIVRPKKLASMVAVLAVHKASHLAAHHKTVPKENSVTNPMAALEAVRS